jgi:ABC-type transporter Mla maintaining outer membrane lipid asymmetry ATPase subunit MlaF
MLYDEPTMSLDPIMAIQVLDLVIRARDIDSTSSMYVTKKIYEIPHLAKLVASRTENGEVVITEARPDALPRTRVLVLDEGRSAFNGTVEEFQKSELPAIKELMTLDRHDHAKDPYFIDPWDKRRRPAEKLL